MIGLAAEGEDHVNVLSALAEVLQDEELCERLWATDDADLVYETLSRTDFEDEDEAPDDETSVEVEILNPAGLHARPASLLVEKAKSHECEITIAKGTKTANAKSIMSVLALGASTGDSVVVTAVGPDSESAIAEVIEIMQSEEET